MAEKSSAEYVTNTPKPALQYVEGQWWNAHTREGEQAHDYLNGHVQSMRLRQATRYTNFRKLNAIYEWGFRAGQIDTYDEPALNEYTNAYNAAQNVVETAHSVITKTGIVPMPLTTGGGYLQRKRAKDLQKALEGEYDTNDVDQIVSDLVFDALICGAGITKVYCEFGRVKIGFVPADDMTVDDAEGRYRKPSCVYQTTKMDRYKVLEIYGGNEDWLHGDMAARRQRILDCKASEIRGTSGATYATVDNDQIDVHEGWHLPSGPDAGDGRWAVCIDGCTLVDMKRDRDRFPFAVYIPRPRRRGFWGLSMMFDMAANQNEYERLTKKIQKAHQKMGGSHIIAPRQAQVNPREIDNDQGTFFEYDGQVPPREFNPEPVAGQTYSYQASIPETMMRSRGISPMSGSGEVPAGLQQASGKALQVFKDEQNGRLKPYFKALDRWHVDLCQLIIKEAREIVENDGSYKVNYASKKAIEKVDWAKVLMDEEDLVLKVFPVSSLSQDPSAKFEQLQELLNAGAITIEQFKRLFELPDIEAETEIDTADTDIVDRNLDIMVTEGRYLSPEPFDNLVLAKARAGKFYNVCRANAVPEARLELLRNYIQDCDSLLAQAAPPPPQPGPPMAPPGAPPMMGPPPGGEIPPMPPGPDMPPEPPMPIAA